MRTSENTASVAIVILLCVSISVTSSWDPDAGLVTSLTKFSSVRVFASSNTNDSALANDGLDNTHWTSHGCLPKTFYLANALTNVLLDACLHGRCSSSSSSEVSGMRRVTDASGYTGYTVGRGDHPQATFSAALPARDSLRHVTVRGVFTAPTQLLLADGESQQVVGTLTDSDNYQERDFNVTLTPATSVTLRSAENFQLFVLGAIGEGGCVERVYVDLGSLQQVRYVRTRHWAGHNGLTSYLVASVDGVAWQKLGQLDPNALQPVVTEVGPPAGISVRYLGVQHRQDESSYAKVYMWEIDAYPDSGIHGDLPSPSSTSPNPASLREILGVNGIWGWGWGKASYLLVPGQGSQLYAPVASWGRNYHNLAWDVRDPDHRPRYVNGTEANWWLDWDREYAAWRAGGVPVHVTVQFLAKTFPVSMWDSPYNSSFQYGYTFARHFGPTHGNGLVRSVEVGNEPWDYPADFYRTVLQGMASGFKAGDPHMVVMPGAFQAHDPSSTGNYIGPRVTQEVAGEIDVINSHHYSWRSRTDGSRHATFPEDPAGSFLEVLSVVRWRDVNTPDKAVWVTEWGWDSPGGGQDCSRFSECTTEAAASAYTARGLMLLARLGVARAAWFFYGNLDDCNDHVFCRSGLTSSKSAHFAKKGPYYVLQNLLHLMGQAHFLRVLREDSHAYVYEFGTSSTASSASPSSHSSHATATHIVAWRPVDAETEGSREVSVSFSYPSSAALPARAWTLRADGFSEQETSLPASDGLSWTMDVSAMPTVVQLEQPLTLIG